MAFIRQRMIMGDAITGSTLTTRRKSAGAGTRAKAQRHRFIRARRMMGDPFLGMTGKSVPMPKGLDIGAAMKGMFGKIAPIAKGALSSGFFGPAGALAGSLLPGAGSTISPGAAASLQRRGAAPTSFGPPIAAPDFGGGGGFGGGGKRRSINPTNVKALRRSIRRFEGFKNLVKRVDKMLPSGAKLRPSAPSFKKKGRR